MPPCPPSLLDFPNHPGTDQFGPGRFAPRGAGKTPPGNQAIQDDADLVMLAADRTNVDRHGETSSRTTGKLRQGQWLAGHRRRDYENLPLGSRTESQRERHGGNTGNGETHFPPLA